MEGRQEEQLVAREVKRTHFHRVGRQAARHVDQDLAVAARSDVGHLGAVTVPQLDRLLGLEDVAGDDRGQVADFFWPGCGLVVDPRHVVEKPRRQDRNTLVQADADRIGDVFDVALELVARFDLFPGGLGLRGRHRTASVEVFVDVDRRLRGLSRLCHGCRCP